MNARTCQLCGKPLSRIWVGAGGDFCSREHRNQYRLRRGMDRLLEENKVANLMRRRENPKAIRGMAVQSASASAHRGYWDGKKPPAPEGPQQGLPSLEVSRAPLRPAVARIVPLKKAAALRLTGTGTGRRREASYARVAVRADLAVPRRKLNMPVKLSQARIVRLRMRALGAAGRERKSDVLRRSQRGVVLGGGGKRRADGSGAENLQKAGRLRALRTKANRGQALRVSSALGFRVARPGPARIPIDAGLTARMTWRETARLKVGALSGRTPGARVISVNVATLGMWCPSGPRQRAASGMRWPGPVPMPPSEPRKSAPVAKRTLSTVWNRSSSDPRCKEHRASAAPAGLSRWGQVHEFEMPAARRGPSLHAQHATVPFEQRDSVFGYSPIQIDGTMAGTMTGGSVPAAAAAPAARIEDHFDAGWANWVGGVEDWKLDAAGVRIGSLALLGPSLGFADYDLEFLARIESRVTWVFRAANFKDYYAATIAKGEDGHYQFSRRTVIGGVEGAPESTPMELTSKGKTTLTVRTRAKGRSFEVSVNGKSVASWRDERLAIGGVGFTGALEDRARLYWVRVSTTESAGKEHLIR